MQQALDESKVTVNSSLCDNIDTKTAFNSIYELISKANAYIDSNVQTNSVKVYLIYNVGQFVSSILKCFGLVYKTDFIDSFVFESNSNTEASQEEKIKPYLDIITQFRDEIRNACKDKDMNKIYSACDKLREEILPQHGVKLEDRQKQPTIWKLYDKEILLKELEEEKASKQKVEKKKNPQANKVTIIKEVFFKCKGMVFDSN